MRWRAMLLLLQCWTMPAAAHEFWIQPAQFWPQPATTLSLLVGHGPDRQRSPIARRRILRFDATAPDGSVTALAPDAALQPTIAGTHMLVLQTDDHAQTRLTAQRFNDYVEAEGLTPARTERQRTGRMQADGSEHYSRVAKSMLQVGDAATPNVTAPFGLPLEIVPEQNPYATPRPAQIEVRVLYDGKPLAGALVKFTDLDHDETPFETRRTDETGRARFTMPTRGSWLFNTVWTRPSVRDVDFETVFSSLSFAVR